MNGENTYQSPEGIGVHWTVKALIADGIPLIELIDDEHGTYHLNFAHWEAFSAGLLQVHVATRENLLELVTRHPGWLSTTGGEILKEIDTLKATYRDITRSLRNDLLMLRASMQ